MADLYKLQFNNRTILTPSKDSFVAYFSVTMQEYVNLGTTEYSRSGASGIVYYALTGMPSSSSFNYFTYIFDAYLSSGNGAADIYLNNASNGDIWRIRTHTRHSYPGFVGITGNVTAWATQSGAPTIGSFTQDGVSYRYCSSKFTKSTYARFKLVFDRNSKICYTYIEGTLLGTVTLNIDPITISKFGLMSETGTSNETAKMKNIKVAGFENLSDAQNWS